MEAGRHLPPDPPLNETVLALLNHSPDGPPAGNGTDGGGGKKKGKGYVAVPGPWRRWAGGVLPYTIANTFTQVREDTSVKIVTACAMR